MSFNAGEGPFGDRVVGSEVLVGLASTLGDEQRVDLDDLAGLGGLEAHNRHHLDLVDDTRSGAGIERNAPRIEGERAIAITGSAQGSRQIGSGYDSSRTGAEHRDVKGFWEGLADLFIPEDDRYTYAEGLRRGGYIVSVRVSEDMYPQALDILDDQGTINMDEREAGWRREGWQGYQGPASLGGTSSRASTEERIPVVEENLRVGKRDTSHGRVRVRSYVVEKPVSEDVRLRNEKVSVERRPVDRPASGGEQLFKDRTVEMEEHAEEAVMAKEARVKEEVVVKKHTEERVEHVADKVRRTDVTVEDERGKPLPKQRRTQ